MNERRLIEIKEQLEGTAIIGELYVKGDPWKGYEAIDEHNGMVVGRFSNETEAKLMADAPEIIVELVDEVERLREALEFYADEANYAVKTVQCWEGTLLIDDSIANEDEGEIAREALQK